MFCVIGKLLVLSMSVLINGELGIGKEFVVSVLYNYSLCKEN